MSDEFNWNKAVNEWQSHQPDMPALKKNMQWLSLRMKLVLALDVISLMVLFPLTYFIFLSEEAFSIKVWFSVACVFAAVGVYFDFYLRKDLWDQPATTKEMFRYLIKRAQAGIRLARFALAYLGIFLIYLLGWWGYVVLYEAERLEKSGSILSLVIASTIIIMSMLIALWYRKRKEQELLQAEKNYQDFIAN
jgi:hypothetical protein